MDTLIESPKAATPYKLKVYKVLSLWVFRIYDYNGTMVNHGYRNNWSEALRSGLYCLGTYYKNDARNLLR